MVIASVHVNIEGCRIRTTSAWSSCTLADRPKRCAHILYPALQGGCQCRVEAKAEWVQSYGPDGREAEETGMGVRETTGKINPERVLERVRQAFAERGAQGRR